MDVVRCIRTDCAKRKECSMNTAPSEYPLDNSIFISGDCNEYITEKEKETKDV